CLTAQDGVHVLTWHYAGGGHGTVLYVGGNAEHVASSRALAEALRERGWDLLVLVPRGFPGSEGYPTEVGFARDVRAAWAYLTGPLHVRPEHVVMHGRSMGGGVVGLLLGEIRPGGWVFESTYDSLDAMAWHEYPYYPVSWMLRFHLNTASRANLGAGPALVAHAATDEVIPVARARALADALRDATVVIAPEGDHQRSILSSSPEANAAWTALLASAAAP
ncbi:MAG TPA: alpha/beta hydrolase, partial [Myxococcota bacterium]|nr:alpha/beta hydrolase [Myxococcota bacterium]